MGDLRLETTRLSLRLMQSSDLDDLLKIFADAKVMASFGRAPFNREQMQRWMKRNLERQSLPLPFVTLHSIFSICLA